MRDYNKIAETAFTKVAMIVTAADDAVVPQRADVPAPSPDPVTAFEKAHKANWLGSLRSLPRPGVLDPIPGTMNKKTPQWAQKLKDIGASVAEYALDTPVGWAAEQGVTAARKVVPRIKKWLANSQPTNLVNRLGGANRAVAGVDNERLRRALNNK